MQRYKVLVTQTEILKYHVDAKTPEEAKELVLSGDYDPYAFGDCSFDDVEVTEEVK